MKILFTVYSSLGYGGAEVSMKLLAEGLKKRGHDVIIASTGDYPGFKTYRFMRFRRAPLFYVHNLYLSSFLSKIIKIFFLMKVKLFLIRFMIFFLI